MNQYRVYFSGVLDKGAIEMVDAPMNWRLELLLEDLETWLGPRGRSVWGRLIRCWTLNGSRMSGCRASP
ncbi:hypothetical protein [Verrucomicrobium spinosum]|uniref:hypothetical protein n=1 Tax=Verrucomicrobium spinosum TaxID=2736 RepID=UPI000AD369DA|nr:hypothetical protein [Verrucomicrobium spinosum]